MSGDESAARRLRRASFEVVGEFAAASNATLLVRLTDRDPRTMTDLADDLARPPELADLDPADLAVHKPQRGEAPLWDFPFGTLHRREVAAYEVSRALGWDLVPATVLVDDGPFGPGSLQRFVPHDPEEHYFTLLACGDHDVLRQLRTMVVFDLVIDNADRKGGHVLLEQPPGSDAADPTRVKLVDHGVSFNVERKLRTVAWDFAGDGIAAELRAPVARLLPALDGDLGDRLGSLLSDAEIEVFESRVRHVAALERFPEPSGRRPYPWPLL